MLASPLSYYSGVSYLISELSDNIIDHAGIERGWLSFQYYPSHHYIDFCIADSGTGIGLLGSYKSYKGEKDFSHIITHFDAVTNVIKGESTKKAYERGFGVHTSREMLLTGLDGQFILLSGNALLLGYQLYNFIETYNGTLALLRVPCKTFNSNFDPQKFVE